MKNILYTIILLFLFSYVAHACPAVCNCIGYDGYGGPCYKGYGGPAYDGYGGPAYDGYGGPCYKGYGGACYEGYGGGNSCPAICSLCGK